LSRKPNAGAWMGAAFGAALVLAVVVLALMGNEHRGVVMALRATGRLSYLLFWPAYAGGALARLFGPSFAPIAQRARCFGLAFAAAHLVHIGLVVRLYQISPEPPVSDSIFLFFAIAVAWTYLLALLSFAPLSQAIGRTWWRILRTVGLEYIAFAFFFDFVIGPLRGGLKHPLAYLPFAALAVAGPVLRLGALTVRPRRVVSP
jgi:hypothetical protein